MHSKTFIFLFEDTKRVIISRKSKFHFNLLFLKIYIPIIIKKKKSARCKYEKSYFAFIRVMIHRGSFFFQAAPKHVLKINETLIFIADKTF